MLALFGLWLLLVCAQAATASSPCIADGFVKSDGPKLVLDGVRYRAVGVNMPVLFSDYIGAALVLEQLYGTPEAARQHVLDAIADAKKSNVAFIRFWASGFWPADMRLYFDDPQAYWKSMDEVFELCRKNGIKLVPSIFFNFSLWPMICGEDYSAIVDPASGTYKAMRKYLEELVSRYKDDTNVLMWEIANEGFMRADLDRLDQDAPGRITHLPDAPTVKTKLKREDSLTTAMLRQFYTQVTRRIKEIDPNHLVTSGDAGVRITSVSLRESFPEQVWTRDTLRENLASLLSSQPEPLDVYSIHSYGPWDGEALPGDLPALDYLRSRVRAVHAARAPVFVGELGNLNPCLKDDTGASWTIEALNALDEEGADLVAVWAWHFPHQPENTFTSSSHPGLSQRISELNKKYAGCR